MPAVAVSLEGAADAPVGWVPAAEEGVTEGVDGELDGVVVPWEIAELDGDSPVPDGVSPTVGEPDVASLEPEDSLAAAVLCDSACDPVVVSLPAVSDAPLMGAWTAVESAVAARARSALAATTK